MAKVSVASKGTGTKQRRVSTFTCFECGGKKDAKEFYKNPANPLGICSICTECIQKMVVDESGEFVVREKLIEVQRKLDRPFIQKEYKQKGQATFIKTYPDLVFEDIFRENYLK